MNVLTLAVMCAAMAGYVMVGYWVFQIKFSMQESLEVRDAKLLEAVTREHGLMEELSIARREATDMRDKKNLVSLPHPLGPLGISYYINRVDLQIL
jgi:hypothetical protein